MASLAYEPTQIPWSRSGSYLSINHLWDWAVSPEKPVGWYLRSVRRATEVFRVAALREGQELALTARATPGRLTFAAEGGGTIEFCFADENTLRVRARGCALGLDALMGHYGQAYTVGADCHLLTGPDSEHFLCRPLRGRLVSDLEWVHTPWNDEVRHVGLRLDGDGGGEAEMLIHGRPRLAALPALPGTFDADADRGDAEFDRFLAAFPPVAPEWAETAARAALCLWVSTVAPEGLLRSPAVLMSKNWMTSVWSWDHCFVALGLARAHPDLAWRQFLLPFEFQDESGLLPDCVNTRQTSWLCTKSPVHGWALRRLLQTGAFGEDHCEEAYGPLSRWAEYWLRERDLDGGGLPYFLHGNEQFDNTTLFQIHAPYRAADLAAYLVILQEVLADLADRLGKPSEALGWRRGASALLERIVPALWDGEHFLAPRLGDGAAAEGDCLFRYTALVLGRRLPPEIAAKMTADLREPGRFRTAFGALATEALTSPFYEDVSYVRGPIWAPPNMLIADGLRDLGQTEAAEEIRDGFLGLCARSGFSENFHARTGAGQRDPAYTWTAGAFLAWAQEAADLP